MTDFMLGCTFIYLFYHEATKSNLVKVGQKHYLKTATKDDRRTASIEYRTTTGYVNDILNPNKGATNSFASMVSANAPPEREEDNLNSIEINEKGPSHTQFR